MDKKFGLYIVLGLVIGAVFGVASAQPSGIPLSESRWALSAVCS